MLTTAPVLAYFSPDKEVVVQGDANQSGLGAVLMQDGHIIEYCSRMMSSTEKLYAQVEKEMLAILFGLERFDTYISTPDVSRFRQTTNRCWQ